MSFDRCLLSLHFQPLQCLFQRYSGCHSCSWCPVYNGSVRISKVSAGACTVYNNLFNTLEIMRIHITQMEVRNIHVYWKEFRESRESIIARICVTITNMALYEILIHFKQKVLFFTAIKISNGFVVCFQMKTH